MGMHARSVRRCLRSRPRALDLMPHSFSRSRQFVIYAREGAVRGGVGTLAEDTKSGLLNALGIARRMEAAHRRRPAPAAARLRRTPCRRYD